MNLRQISPWGQSPPPTAEEPGIPNTERCLTLLAEGAAKSMLQIDAQAHKEFCARVSKMALKVPDGLPGADKLPVVQNILHEFEGYHHNLQAMARDRQIEWRTLVTELLKELLTSLGVDAASGDAAPISGKIAGLVTAEDIRLYHTQLMEFLHPGGGSIEVSALKIADRSTANDNAAGLPGGGSAIEYLKRIMARDNKGFVVVFRLGCLDMIGERFGWEAIHDCLMAVSAYLTHSLHSNDIIYHWSDSSLLAIMQGRANEQMLSAELNRIAAHNRDITVQIDGRTIMLRIPLDFDITVISRLRSADDLYKLAPECAVNR